MSERLQSSGRVRLALLVLASIGCTANARLQDINGSGRGGDGAAGTGAAGTGGTAGAGGVGAVGGSGGLAGGGGRGPDDIGPPVTCPPGTETPLSSPVIADFSTAGSNGLPVLAAPFRAYVTSNVTSEVSNGTWHLAGDKVQGGPVAYPVHVGIDFGCVDASAYAGVSFTIDTSGSSCYGVSTTIYDASTGELYDDLSINGQTKTTVKIPFTQKWFNGQRAVHAIEWAATSVDSCRSEIRISDLRFYPAPGGAGSGGTAGTTGAGGGGGTSGAGANDGACLPGLETSLASPLAADFSKGASGRFPVLETGYSSLLVDYQLPLTSEISDGAWHVAGIALGNGLGNRTEIGVGIVFPCVDPSNTSGVSFTIDTSGAACGYVSVTITDIYGRSYSRGVGPGTKKTVQIPWSTATNGWAGLKRVMWQPYSLDVTTSCVFDWKIDDVSFY